MENRNLILKWQIFGFFFIIIVGSFFHFLFELSGYFFLVGAIAAVNESVWEHLKLAFWPIILFALIEYKYIKKEESNFGLAKAAASYVAPILIVIIFYTYTAIIGMHLLLMDILTFIVAVFVAQLINYKLLISRELPNYTKIISMVFIIVLAFIFVLFTYLPPHLPIFRDSTTGFYGISN